MISRLLQPYLGSANGRRRVDVVDADELEVVPAEHDLGEGLVVEEHVDGGGVGQLASVAGLDKKKSIGY